MDDRQIDNECKNFEEKVYIIVLNLSESRNLPDCCLHGALIFMCCLLIRYMYFVLLFCFYFYMYKSKYRYIEPQTNGLGSELRDTLDYCLQEVYG